MIPLSYAAPYGEQANVLADQWKFFLTSQPRALHLWLDSEGLWLRHTAFAPKGARVDFIEGSMGYRRQHPGREWLLRAMGRLPSEPNLIDATAGWGRDSALLAQAGFQVQMVEKHPVLVALLSDGLARATAQQPDFARNLQLIYRDSRDLFAERLTQPHPNHRPIIYLDPMFPPQRKTALVKKEMQLLHALLGTEPRENEDQSLEMARKIAHRVVVKRPKSALPLADAPPHFSIHAPTLRFDVYVCHQNF